MKKLKNLLPTNLSPERVYSLALVFFVLMSLGWLEYIGHFMPPISRGDFLWEMWHIGPSIFDGNWGEVLKLIFKIFGGHFCVYTRILQIINFIYFDYSGEFVKYTAVMVYVISLLALLFCSSRVFGKNTRGALFLVFGTVLICSKRPYDVIGWTDSLVTYFACLIGAFLFLPKISDVFKKDKIAGLDFLKVSGLTILILLGCGIGWAFLASMFFLYFITRPIVTRLFNSKKRWLYISAFLIGLIALLWLLRWGVLEFSQPFLQQFHMARIYTAFSKMFSNMQFLFMYFFSTLALPIWLASFDKSAPVGVIVFLFWVFLFFNVLKKNLVKENVFLIGFSIFGMLSAFFVALGRWEIAASNAYATPLNYYSIFTIPFYLSLPMLCLVCFSSNIQKYFIYLGTFAMITNTVISDEFIFDKEVRGTSIWHQVARDQAKNWNPIMQQRLSGAAPFAHQYFFGVMKDMKKWGKYKALTEDFIFEPEPFLAQLGLNVNELTSVDSKSSSESEKCNGGKVSKILVNSADDRSPLWNLSDEPTLYLQRTYGFAYSLDCSAPADYVFMLDKNKKVLCVSRTGAMNWDIQPEQRTDELLKNNSALFDFSCPSFEPLAQRGPFSIFSYSRRDLGKVRLLHQSF